MIADIKYPTGIKSGAKNNLLCFQLNCLVKTTAAKSQIINTALDSSPTGSCRNQPTEINKTGDIKNNTIQLYILKSINYLIKILCLSLSLK